MNEEKPDAIVIGAGVSGLTTAMCLTEAGTRVAIWTSEPTEATTSMAAGAMWGPYHVEPLDMVTAWSSVTLEALRKLARQTGAGVRLVSGVEAARHEVDPPSWGDQLDGFRMCDRSELPHGFSTGWRYTAPLVDMSMYLTYLRQRLDANGVQIHRQRVAALVEMAGKADVIVNCAGLGARDLVPDPSVFPVRGQIVVVKNPGITEFFSEDTGAGEDLLHYYPHQNTVVLGGTAQPGSWNPNSDPETAAAIVRRCAEVEPSLRGAEIIAHRVGLRPTRSRVRVDSEQLNGTRIVHNYGHGGAGVTLSWGCAMAATKLALAA